MKDIFHCIVKPNDIFGFTFCMLNFIINVTAFIKKMILTPSASLTSGFIFLYFLLKMVLLTFLGQSSWYTWVYYWHFIIAVGSIENKFLRRHCPQSSTVGPFSCIFLSKNYSMWCRYLIGLWGRLRYALPTLGERVAIKGDRTFEENFSRLIAAYYLPKRLSPKLPIFFIERGSPFVDKF